MCTLGVSSDANVHTFFVFIMDPEIVTVIKLVFFAVEMVKLYTPSCNYITHNPDKRNINHCVKKKMII